jgi:hypothetical protein
MRLAVEMRCGLSAPTSSSRGIAEVVADGRRDRVHLGSELLIADGEAGRVAGALGELFQMRVSPAAEGRRVQSRHPQVGDPQSEAVLAPVALVEIPELDECGHVAVCGCATRRHEKGDAERSKDNISPCRL